MARKRLYIPITRSGSSILASVITQLINQPRTPKPPGATTPGNGFATFLVVLFYLFILVAIFYK